MGRGTEIEKEMRRKRPLGEILVPEMILFCDCYIPAMLLFSKTNFENNYIPNPQP